MSTVAHQNSSAPLHPAIAAVLQRFAGRRRRLLIVRSVAAFVVVWLLVSLLIVAVDYQFLIGDSNRWALSLMGYAAALYAAYRMGLGRLKSDRYQIAAEIQTAQPQLNDDLLSALELADAPERGDSPEFRRWAQDRTAQRVATIDPAGLLPWKLIARWLIIAAALIVVVAMLFFVPPAQWARRIGRAMLPGVRIERASITQIEIFQPAPPSRYVAEGDAVAVVAGLRALGDGPVWLEHTTGGEIKQTPLSVRQTDVQSTEDADSFQRFAGNLSVTDVPLQYRLHGGDAVTLWYTLTPQRRPEVVRIRTRYRYPGYTGLPDLVTTSGAVAATQRPSPAGNTAAKLASHEPGPDGNLQAVVGTIATVSFGFDQPVRDATLRYDSNGRPIAMLPDAEQPDDPTSWSAEIPIRTPTTYTPDAIAIRSELNQPFGPRYSVTPMVDAAPLAIWTADDEHPLLDGQIVGPLATIPVRATIEDDLPMDMVLQEIQINNDPLMQRLVSVDGDRRRIDARWSLDLLHLTGADETRLKAGDLVRVRVVGVDRRGQRGASPFAEFLIADEGFDANRHRQMLQRLATMRQLDAALLERESFLKTLEDSLGENGLAGRDDWQQTASQLPQSNQAIAAQLESLVTTAGSQTDGLVWRGIGRYWDTATAKTDRLLARIADWNSAIDIPEFDDRWREQKQRQSHNDAKELRRSVDSFRKLTSSALGLELSAGRIDDAIKLRQSLAPLISLDSPLPRDRFPRYVQLATARLMAISALGESFRDLLPSSTVNQMGNFEKFCERWFNELRNAATDPENPDRVRNLSLQFENEFRNQIAHGMWDDNLTNQLGSAYVDRRDGSDSIGKQLHGAAAEGREMLADQDRATSAKSDGDRIRMRTRAEWNANQFSRSIESISRVLAADQNRGRRLKTVDLRSMADLNLIQRAIENITRNGYAAFQQEPAEEVYKQLVPAIETLTATSEIAALQSVVTEIAARERAIENSGEAKVLQPWRVDYFLKLMSGPVQQLRQLGMDWEKLKTIDESHYNEPAQRMRTVITSRRWSAAPTDEQLMVSAEQSARQLADQLAGGLAGLGDEITAARKTVLKYVETLPEQARRAAAAAESARGNEDDSADSTGARNASDSDRPRDDLQASVDEALRQAAQTTQTLIDRANNADVLVESSADSIRDADAASQLLSQARQAAVDADAAVSDKAEDSDASPQQIEDAIAARDEALDGVSETLQRIADHFESAEAGRDVSDSRARLRAAAQQSRSEQELELKRRRIEQLAQQLATDPRALLAELEKQLAGDPVMRDELSTISDRALDAAAAQMNEAADRQNSLRKQIEQSDPEIAEWKRRLKSELESMKRRAADSAQPLLDRARQAIDAAPRDEQTKDAIDRARGQFEIARSAIADAIDRAAKTSDESALLESFQTAAGEIAENLRTAAAAANQVAAAAADQQSYSPAGGDDENSRRAAEQKLSQTRKQMDQIALSSITRQTQSLKQQQDFWQNVKRESENRARNAQRQRESLERQMEQRAKQLERAKPDSDQAKQLTDQRRRDERQKQDLADDADRATATAALAEKRETAAESERKAIQESKFQPTESNNPAVETSNRLATAAAEELQRLARQAAAIAGAMPSRNAEIAGEKTSELSQQQSAIGRDVTAAIEELQRAARHEQRLERDATAAQLATAADQADNVATPAVRTADETLRRAAEQRAGEQRAGEQRAGEQRAGAADGSAEAAANDSKGEVSTADSPAASAVASTETAEAAIRSAAEQIEAIRRGEAITRAAENGEPPAAAAASTPQADTPEANSSDQAASGADSSSNDATQSRGRANPGQQNQVPRPQDSTTAASPSSAPSAAEKNSRNKANQLDELDRAIAESRERAAAAATDGDARNSGSTASGDDDSPSGQQAAGGGENSKPGSQPNDPGSSSQSAGEDGSGQPSDDSSGSSAGDLSPSLAAAMNRQIQAAAQQRQDRLRPPQRGGQSDSGQQPQTAAASGQTSDQPGSGNQPDGRSVSIDGIDRAGSDWGDLRDRVTDDAAETNSEPIPPQYRKQLEAYFKGIAEDVSQ